MNQYDEYDINYSHELETRTETFCVYDNHVQSFYMDSEHTKPLIKFNLEEIAKRYSLGSWFAELQYDIIIMARRGCIAL